jgi:hypothetical protein
MADLNPYANPSFQRTYLDMLDNSHGQDPFSIYGHTREDAFDSLNNPAFSMYNSDIGPTKDSNVMPGLIGFRQPSTDYLNNIFSKPLDSSVAIQASPLNPATNAAQKSKSTANVLSQSLAAVQGLMNEGRAIPEGLAQQGINLSQYGRVERDIRGNVIGLAPKPVYGPTGSVVGTVGDLKPYEAKQGSAGNPLTPGLDALKAMQKEQAQPESEQSKANRAAFESSVKSSYQPQIEAQKAKVAQEAAQAGKPTLPTGAIATQVQTPQGTQTTISGPSGYAQALIPKKKDIA